MPNNSDETINKPHEVLSIIIFNIYFILFRKIKKKKNKNRVQDKLTQPLIRSQLASKQS